MLQEIIDLQQQAVTKLVEQLRGNKKEITFKAPTGSGKTFMMSDFMNRILAENDNIVFLVSSLSKGDLARQNFEKFAEYKAKGNFTKIDPYLINSNIAGEERLYIPPTHNVYVLPRDLYKSGGRLMQGAMENFLMNFVMQKQIILIRDECHIATNNLDSLSENYFAKAVNFSATPKLARGQTPDVEIKNQEAENCKLIKTIEWGNREDTVADAVNVFEQVKEDYRNLLNVNPCLIIQISNKDKADEELTKNIFPILNAKPHLKWVLIVDDDKKCDTNDNFKVKKLPVSKWKDYAKSNASNIDIIIFKMVITEGWDIPRACMLYQVRETTSKQLDEQVIGRVRRNPRLLDFETLGEKAQQLSMTAWVWGVLPEEQQKVFGVKLYDEPQDTTDNIKVRVTKLKPLTRKKGFDIKTFVESQTKKATPTNIFELGKALRQTDNQVRAVVYGYATDYTTWWQAAEFVPEIEKAINQFLCNYDESMEIAKDESDNEIKVSFAPYSHYTDNGNTLRINNWVWKRRDGVERFSFDSEAEQDWADVLKDLSQHFASTTVGKVKKNKHAGSVNLFGEVAADTRENEKEIFLWGKNFVSNSAIKFEYYMGALHSSYPDFVMKDTFGRIHIFEVKSVNESANYTFDSNIYKAKIEELKKCYKQASKLTEQIFYLPIMKGNDWQILRFYKGEEKQISQDEFERFVKEA